MLLHKACSGIAEKMGYETGGLLSNCLDATVCFMLYELLDDDGDAD